MLDMLKKLNEQKQKGESPYGYGAVTQIGKIFLGQNADFFRTARQECRMIQKFGLYRLSVQCRKLLHPYFSQRFLLTDSQKGFDLAGFLMLYRHLEKKIRQLPAGDAGDNCFKEIEGVIQEPVLSRLIEGKPRLRQFLVDHSKGGLLHNDFDDHESGLDAVGFNAVAHKFSQIFR